MPVHPPLVGVPRDGALPQVITVDHHEVSIALKMLTKLLKTWKQGCRISRSVEEAALALSATLTDDAILDEKLRQASLLNAKLCLLIHILNSPEYESTVARVRAAIEHSTKSPEHFEARKRAQAALVSAATVCLTSWNVPQPQGLDDLWEDVVLTAVSKYGVDTKRVAIFAAGAPDISLPLAMILDGSITNVLGPSGGLQELTRDRTTNYDEDPAEMEAEQICVLHDTPTFVHANDVVVPSPSLLTKMWNVFSPSSPPDIGTPTEIAEPEDDDPDGPALLQALFDWFTSLSCCARKHVFGT